MDEYTINRGTMDLRRSWGVKLFLARRRSVNPAVPLFLIRTEADPATINDAKKRKSDRSFNGGFGRVPALLLRIHPVGQR